jgi:hypothetical protein
MREPHGTPNPRAQLLTKRYRLPAGLSCQEFVMRELTAEDELEAAMWADKRRTSAHDGILSMVGIEQREAMRLSLVEVAGQSVTCDGVPSQELDGWRSRTMRFVLLAFNDLNAVDVEDLSRFRLGAEVLSPTPTAPKRAPTGE